MPFTFSHPAAILPFSNTSNRLSQTGLVIGSIVPDLEFYLQLKLNENIGHTLKGILLFDLPVAFMMALIFHCLIKIPLVKASPVWIQSRTIQYLGLNWLSSLKTNWIGILCSMLLGILTHLILDGMTHYDGWMVELFPVFQETLGDGLLEIPMYDFLQYAFSFLGLVWVLYSLTQLKVLIVLDFESSKKRRFWKMTFMGFGLAVLFRMLFYPDFISFWDVFMMGVGAFIYGVIFASIGYLLAGNRSLNRDRKLHEFVNSRSVDPGFKSRSLLIKQNQFFGLFGQRIMNVNYLVNETQVIISQPSDIQIDEISLIRKYFGQFTSQGFGSTAFSLADHFHFQGGFFVSSYRKVADLYFHVCKSLKKYINTPLKLIGFLGLIFIPIAANGQEKPFDPALREQFIQKASELRAAEKYGEAISQLDSILLHHPADAQILLFKGDLCLQNQDFSQAVEVFHQLIPLDYESTIVKINLSYALFMSKKPSKALEAAFTAWSQDSKNKSATVNYFNALLWNIKTKEAEAFLSENTELVDPDQSLVMKARLYTTAGNYSNGLAYYDSLVQQFPKAPYIQEYAEVLIGKKQWKKADHILKKYEPELSSSQLQKLNGLISDRSVQTVGVTLGFFADVAKNTRTEQAAFWQNPRNAPVQIGFRAGASQVKALEGQVTNSSFLAGGANIVWSQAWQSSGELMVQQVKPGTGDSFIGITGKFETKFQPNDRRMVGITYGSDLLNFTADLLGKNIRSQNLGYVTHLMFGGKTGFYSQGSYGILNDQNSRIQFFGSIYRLLRTEPTLKTGVNFSALSYRDSETTLYFAPNRFMSAEVFVDYSTPMPLVSKMAFKIQAAGGFQQIEKQPLAPSFRAQAELNYRVNGFDLGLNGQFSNVAASSGTGYKFQYFTFKVSKNFK
ncbi:DUF4184 family protein [Algoriphagus halophilus]|uniref:Tetratricopeptide repeat-containing protein n=1 Tax=Algoriphagus halophilus TaxID=226505 RepID=A0A1N6D611_9BACT|nr:DUF4184 family protein [Algoriphagus halophilus]SIN66147.1 Tetratricopeptide repeat-containing protein [Algoriphagus halophilus]